MYVSSHINIFSEQNLLRSRFFVMVSSIQSYQRTRDLLTAVGVTDCAQYYILQHTYQKKRYISLYVIILLHIKVIDMY